MKLTMVQIPSIKDPIKASPGFHKKQLADFKLDIMGLCGFGCSYCSSNEGNYLRINRARFAEMTREQTGETLLPSTTPGLTFQWADFEQRLDEQLARKPKDGSWGAGQTLVFSQLTDAFSPWAVASGLTRRTLEKVLARTSFRIRVLTKSATVGSDSCVKFFGEHPGRFVVGLSIGTLDNEWARRVEIGTSSPTARVAALRKLQDAGVPTFGMLCPIFPGELEGDGVERLVEAIRPEHCETVWSEPYNDRANWRAVAAGYEDDDPAKPLIRSMFEGPSARTVWTAYASQLYRRVHVALQFNGASMGKHRYLLYQNTMTAESRAVMRGAPGVLFQSEEPANA